MSGQADCPGVGSLVWPDLHLRHHRDVAVHSGADGAGGDVDPLPGVQLVSVAPEMLVPRPTSLAVAPALHVQAAVTRWVSGPGRDLRQGHQIHSKRTSVPQRGTDNMLL